MTVKSFTYFQTLYFAGKFLRYPLINLQHKLLTVFIQKEDKSIIYLHNLNDLIGSGFKDIL